MCILICTLVVTNEHAISYINIHPHTHKHVDLYDNDDYIKNTTNDGKIYAKISDAHIHRKTNNNT